jgi:hypothetical protein
MTAPTENQIAQMCRLIVHESRGAAWDYVAAIVREATLEEAAKRCDDISNDWAWVFADAIRAMKGGDK